jgi:hypothetical protein
VNLVVLWLSTVRGNASTLSVVVNSNEVEQWIVECVRDPDEQTSRVGFLVPVSTPVT